MSEQQQYWENKPIIKNQKEGDLKTKWRILPIIIYQHHIKLISKKHPNIYRIKAGKQERKKWIQSEREVSKRQREVRKMHLNDTNDTNDTTTQTTQTTQTIPSTSWSQSYRKRSVMIWQRIPEYQNVTQTFWSSQINQIKTIDMTKDWKTHRK